MLITAGPTFEKIDPVRFIGNYSSGKMGFALAEECAKRGAKVTLVAGPVALSASKRIERIDVESGEEMYHAANKAFKTADVAILCAAVADYKPQNEAKEKIKTQRRQYAAGFDFDTRHRSRTGQTKDCPTAFGGLCARNSQEECHAKEKLKKKNLDFIVLNSMRNEGTTFQTDDNQINIINATENKAFEKKSKTLVAIDIINEVEAQLQSKK